MSGFELAGFGNFLQGLALFAREIVLAGVTLQPAAVDQQSLAREAVFVFAPRWAPAGLMETPQM